MHFDACFTATDKPCPAPIIPILPSDETICASPDLQHIPCRCSTKKPAFLNRISNDARNVKKPGFWGVLHKPGIGCKIADRRATTIVIKENPIGVIAQLRIEILLIIATA